MIPDGVQEDTKSAGTSVVGGIRLLTATIRKDKLKQMDKDKILRKVSYCLSHNCSCTFVPEAC